MHVDVANDRGVVDDDRALGSADLLVEHPVRLRDLTVRPEVAAQRVLRPTERIGPRLERVDAVTREAHDLGTSTGETLLKSVQRRRFAVSGIREGPGEERKDDALATQLRERDLAPIVRPKAEVGSSVADPQRFRLGRDLR